MYAEHKPKQECSLLTYEFSNSTEGPGVAGRVGVEKLYAKLKWERYITSYITTYITLLIT